MGDLSQQLQAQVKQAYADKQALNIQGGKSKSFLGHSVSGELVDLSTHTGVIDYQPTELTLRARAGTPLIEINDLLASHKQKLGFNPPIFNQHSTLGGTVAAKQSGPQSPFYGSVRDAILGTQILDGQGTQLQFGGQVMKNVAGYDVSRFLSGSFGTLGVLLDFTVRVIPIPARQITLSKQIDAQASIELLADWIRKSVPVSAACHNNNLLTIELTGTERSLDKYSTMPEISVLDDNTANKFWADIRDHRHDFFQQLNETQNLWSLIVPAYTQADSSLQGDWLYDWAGAQRWFISGEPETKIRLWCQKQGGYATLFRSGSPSSENSNMIFHPLATGLQELHRRIKFRFDPGLILNKGKMYPELDIATSQSNPLAVARIEPGT